MAAFISAADWNLSAGSLRMQRSTSFATAGRIPAIGAGVSLRMAASVPIAESARKGIRPASISYTIVPRLNRSLRASTASPDACSGDIYGAVPTIAPTLVSGVVVSDVDAAAPVAFARPKSTTFTRSAAGIMMFDGFRSRCTIDARCATISASATCAASRSARSAGRGPEAIRSASVPPSTNSMAM